MPNKLPQLQDANPVFNRYQTLMQSALAPVLNNPMSAANQVTITDSAGNTTNNITLLAASSPNIIPIGLSQPLSGWIITRIKGNAVVWDTQDSNSSPNQTLYLNTSADVVVQLVVW